MEAKTPKIEKEERLKIGIYQGDGNSLEYEAMARLFTEAGALEPMLPFAYGSAAALSAAAKNLGLNDPNVLTHTRIQDVKGRRVQVVSPETPEPENQANALLEQIVRDIREGQLRALVTLPVSGKNVALTVAQACGGGAYRILLGGGTMRLNFLTSVQRPDAEQYLSVERVEQRLRAIFRTMQSDFSITTPRIAVLSAERDMGASALSTYDGQVLKPLVVKLFEEGMPVFGPYPAKSFLHSPDFRAFDAVLCMYKEQMEQCVSYFHPYDLRYYTAGLPVIHIEPFFTDLDSEDAFRSLYRSVCVVTDIANSRAVYRKISENPLPYRAMGSFRRDTPAESDNTKE